VIRGALRASSWVDASVTPDADYLIWINPFRHRIETDSARLAPSAPSTANARLQVTGLTCRLAGSLPASRQCSDRPGVDGLDRAGHGFFMTDDVAEELLVAAEVIAGFRCARV
jgi:hypothetical protein